MEPLLALGFMSGTSLDGIDAAFLYSDGTEIFEKGPVHFCPYPSAFRQQLEKILGFSTRTALIEEVEIQLTHYHAQLANKLIADYDLSPALIGFHGQTIFHSPPHTVQIGDGPLLAQLTGVPVIYDFRTHDCAKGGQGAPLVPIYHQALAKDLPKPLAFLNIGGVSNITSVSDNLIAFDAGPGNALIDDYMKAFFNLPYDTAGEKAAQGRIKHEWVEKWLQHSYFSLPYPKSLDRNDFHFIKKDLQSLSPLDAIATLTFFTVQAIVKAINLLPETPQQLIVSGGGAKNTTMVQWLQQELKGIKIKTAFQLGWNSDFIEAEAFAYLAIRSFYGLPYSFPLTTGVKSPLTGGRKCDVHHLCKKA